MLSFVKMQGTGNDYVYMDTFRQKIANPVELAIRLSDRHFGIGSDGLILLHPYAGADFAMEIYNADGSLAEMCGNGIRCAAKYAHDQGLIPPSQTELAVMTGAGMRKLTLHLAAGNVQSVTVDMGEPIFEPEQIPVLAAKQGMAPVVRLTAQDKTFALTCISMGNPHAVTFVPEVADFDVMGYGTILEKAAAFPKRANIEFVKLIDRQQIQMRVWERGSGETWSCGTGSCASAVAAMLQGFTERQVTVRVLGGALQIEWNEQDNHVYMSGPAVTVFSGTVEE